MNYWRECIIEAFEDAGIVVTDEQMDTVIAWVEGAHENYSMAMGYHCIPNPLKAENEELKRELKKEKDKVVCKSCKGRGAISECGGLSTCWKCGGEGRYNL